MGGIGISVLAYAAFLDVEAREAEYLLLESAALLCRQLTHKELLCIAAVSRIPAQVFYLFHASLIPFAVDAQTLAEVKGVHTHLLGHDYHQVIGRLVVYQQFAIAVGDDSSRRILYASEESIRVGVSLEVLTQHL